MTLCDAACREARTATVVMLRNYGVYLDGVGGRRSSQRMFRKGQRYRVCPHTATTMVCVGAARSVSP